MSLFFYTGIDNLLLRSKWTKNCYLLSENNRGFANFSHACLCFWLLQSVKFFLILGFLLNREEIATLSSTRKRYVPSGLCNCPLSWASKGNAWEICPLFWFQNVGACPADLVLHDFISPSIALWLFSSEDLPQKANLSQNCSFGSFTIKAPRHLQLFR